MKELVNRYQQLTEREQRLVLISAIVVIVGLFYWVVWSPLNHALENGVTSVEAKKSELAWVQKNANRAIQLRNSSGKPTNFSGSLPQAVNQAAGRLNIAIARMQPQGDELKVWVDEAPFNDVLSLLQNLENRGIKIINADFAQADAPGHIKVRNLQLGK